MGTKNVVLGEGRLSWPKSERVGDRYGAVFLMVDGDSLSGTSGYVEPANPPVGRGGTLVAEVLESRKSTHIGDLFHRVMPSRPAVGEQIVLGSGLLFIEPTRFGPTTVGLRPADGRPTMWMNIHALYRAHEQTVRLRFEESADA